MLHNLDWLATGKSWPPPAELDRLQRYEHNLRAFNSEKHGQDNEYSRRVSRVIGNYGEIISFPMILNYQKLIALKMADLICGEAPVISLSDPSKTGELNNVLDAADFNSKVYTTVIDIGRYGDAVWRIFRNDAGKNTFTVWDPREWYPIVAADGTNQITAHVLCWLEDRGTETVPDFFLVAQIHRPGSYIKRVYHMINKTGSIGDQVGKDEVISTGLDMNAIVHVKAYSTTDTIYGSDDFTSVEIIISELEVRFAQISNILDKHADPALCGPTSLLKTDPNTGERTFRRGKYYACSPEDKEPKYLTWDGQLESSFKQIEMLLGQLYVLSEMGAVLAGANEGSLQAVSAQAMRFKMVTPLVKARRISNALTRSTKLLVGALINTNTELADVTSKDITITWQDGLPDDPREIIEYIKLASGENKVMPLKTVLMRMMRCTEDEADQYLAQIDARTVALAAIEAVKPANLDAEDPENTHRTSGPAVGTMPTTKSSINGISNPKSPKNV